MRPSAVEGREQGKEGGSKKGRREGRREGFSSEEMRERKKGGMADVKETKRFVDHKRKTDRGLKINSKQALADDDGREVGACKQIGARNATSSPMTHGKITAPSLGR